MNDIIEYGEIIPGYTLRKKSYKQGGNEVEMYQLCLDNFPIFEFGEKPTSYKKFLRDEIAKGQSIPCATGWTYNATKATENFKFSPKDGGKIHVALLKSGWNFYQLSDEKRYDELDQGIYMFNLAGEIIESKVTLSD